MTHSVTTPAETDLLGITRYTRRRSWRDRVSEYIHGRFASFQRLAENPEIGQARDHLKPGLRIAPHRQHYFICYGIHGDEVQILRVVHTSRDLARQLAGLRDPNRLKRDELALRATAATA